MILSIRNAARAHVAEILEQQDEQETGSGSAAGTRSPSRRRRSRRFWMKLCRSPSGSMSCVMTPERVRSRTRSGPSAASPRRTPPGTSRNKRHSRISSPATGCSSTASNRPVIVSGRLGSPTATLMTRSALALRGAKVGERRRPPRCSARPCPAAFGRHLVDPAQQFLGGRRAAPRSRSPPARRARRRAFPD